MTRLLIGAIFVARAPTYCTKDAGPRDNLAMEAFYCEEVGGDIEARVVTDVDDTVKMAAEAYALQTRVKESMRVRMAITAMQGKQICGSGTLARRQIVGRWVIDCQSLAGHVKTPTFRGCSNARLTRELIRWIDASCTTCDSCDPVTNTMSTPLLDRMLKRARMDLKPIDARVLAKMKKQNT